MEPLSLEPFTLDRNFHKQDIIDNFLSVIWTERYYGDSEVELNVPITYDMIQKLPVGIFLGLNESNEIMITENVNIEADSIKITGISLVKWLNNRIVRATAVHKDKYWSITDTPGKTLWDIVYNMCVDGSPYLDGTIDIGIPNPEKLVIPGLGLDSYDNSGDDITSAVPYGPLYDALKTIATTYKIGMQIILKEDFTLGFRSYKGVDRTSNQTENFIVRFSPQTDSFIDITEVQSIEKFKTIAYSFAPGFEPTEGHESLTPITGVASLAGEQYTGFDLRALLVFADDITKDTDVSMTQEELDAIMNSRAREGLIANTFIKGVDGEILPEVEFKYGVDYNLGDIIEVQGNSKTIQACRVTEYIHSQDSAGKKTYPTVVSIDQENQEA